MIYKTHALRHLRFTIGRNIHQHRLNKQWPLHKLARQSGVSEFMLDHYKLGKSNITLQDLFRIACALDVQVETLIKDGPAYERSRNQY